MIFGIKEIDNFDLYNVFLAIATNIPQQLKTGFVVQSHISFPNKKKNIYLTDPKLLNGSV